MTREEAVKILKEIWYLTARQTEAIDVAVEALKQAEQKKGKWIKSIQQAGTQFHPDYSNVHSVFYCTSCLETNDRAKRYCPNCGAKMEEE